MRSQVSSLPSIGLKAEMSHPSRCNSVTCVYSQSPESTVGRGVTLPSSGLAPPPRRPQMRMWKVLCAERKPVNIIRWGGGPPASSFPTFSPLAGSPLAGQESHGKMHAPQEAPGCSPQDPTHTRGWEHISESVYILTCCRALSERWLPPLGLYLLPCEMGMTAVPPSQGLY